MRILAVSDAHGDLDAVRSAIQAARPDLLLSCGDWGDDWEVDFEGLEAISARLPVFTVFGNHDPWDWLSEWRNRDGTPVLLPQGDTLEWEGLTLAGISGLRAKSHKKRYHVTDEDVAGFVDRILAEGKPVDILLSHAPAVGVADLAWQGHHAGKPCFLQAFQRLNPQVFLNGHLHRPQEYRTWAGQTICNTGSVAQGDAVLIEAEGEALRISPYRAR